MKKIAITGTIGSGKSSVCQILKELGFGVFDCDERVNCYYRYNHPLFNEIAILFPNCLVDGTISKKCVSQEIFSDSDVKSKLETLLYATLEAELCDAIAICNEPIFFAEVPLLYECGWEKYFDEVVLVVCDEQVAMERLVKHRNLSMDEAKNRLKHQETNQSKIERASKIIYNNSNEIHLKEQVTAWMDKEKERYEFEN